ncbi:MAG: sodium-dependent transporter [Maricaulis sp.]|nr:sodium-dependent transporter [Maricaulis sp.]MDG2043849.1 sodium-dependent transporter [Maricaulis sp.]
MAGAPSAAGTEWSSRFAFIMAAVGSSVGLGNLWRFPYMTGENGGAAFVIVYLICVVFVGYPILMSEFVVGRHAKLSAVGSTRKMAVDAGRSPRWAIAGWVGMLGGFLVLVTYSIVAGWVIAYIFKMANGTFTGMEAEAIRGAFSAFTADTGTVLVFHTMFMLITILIVMQGISGGIEKASVILMPLFFFMLLGMVVYGFFVGDMSRTITYLFTPDFERAFSDPSIWLAALGQAFFSIGVGSAIMITYGAYLSKKENIASSAAIIVGADTAVAIIAGLAIFPIVFAVEGLSANAGPSLFFEALPTAFSSMPMGNYVGAAFFTLAFFAALTSSISLLNATVAWLQEHSPFGKAMSSFIVGAVIWAAGTATVYFSDLGSWLDFISGSVALPLGGLLIAVFLGWVVPRNLVREELPHASGMMFSFFRFNARYVAPIAVTIILILGMDAQFNLGIQDMLFGGGGEFVTD